MIEMSEDDDDDELFKISMASGRKMCLNRKRAFGIQRLRLIDLLFVLDTPCAHLICPCSKIVLNILYTNSQSFES